MNITIDDLIEVIKSYNPDEVDIIRKAYDYANLLHNGQMRQSGEPYIIHPLNVAYILAELHVDRDTVCAGLLHDILEDTNATKEDIINDFNIDIANLVDGVTKISKMNFSTKEDQNFANIRKIITSIIEDIRVVIIKLADRLHNMRTLQYKSEFKQKENSMETLEIYVPLAYFIGAYRIKSELEDISLRYLKPDVYKDLEEKKKIIERKSNSCLQEMLLTIKGMLEDKDIPNEIKIRTKNIYGIYARINEGHKMADIHDLLALKVMVDSIENCYLTLGKVHSIYPPLNDKFKDYICNPKTNMYRSLHTTVFGEEGRLVQTQIRTFDMDRIASFGLTAYWDINKGEARNVMQNDLKEKFQFYRSLSEIDETFGNNKDFVEQVKRELLSTKIYVYTPNGDIIELPKGATAIDFAYKIHTDIGNRMSGVLVNDINVPINYVLKNKDRVRIIMDKTAIPKEEWIDQAQTTHAKRKIKEFKGRTVL